MKIYFQGEPGAYSHIVSEMIGNQLRIDKSDIIGLPNFGKVWDNINENSIGVLPIENSYAGSIHENMYKFLRFNHKVIGEVELDIRHCLLSKGNDIGKIKKVYSHPQALSQCYDFLKSNSIEAISYMDTSSAARMVSENNNDDGIAAIASKEASIIYGLNVLQEDIQDQVGNTTRFFIVASRNNKNELNLKKSGKTTIIFKTRNIPASLYKCLGAFATNGINLTKIESLPSLRDPFSYMFWLDFEGTGDNIEVQNAISELNFFTKEYFIIGEY